MFTGGATRRARRLPARARASTQERKRMQEHVHTGVISFLFAGLSAVVFIQLLRLATAKMVAQGGSMESAGKTIGALVQFG
jgi:hypothetical protein